MKRKKINDHLAEKSTIVFGTMWVFYAFFLYGLLPLLPVLKPFQNQIFYWSGWVQLWALPLLMVGQKVTGRSAEIRDQETHDAVMEELRLAKEERLEQKLMMRELHAKFPDMPELHK
jgi:hypothetical protein